MQYKDEFFPPEKRAGYKNIVSSVFSGMNRRDRVRPRSPVWAGLIVLVLIMFLGGVLWYSYPREAVQREIMAAPIIRADAGPIKVVPKDFGGMNIPHRDSTIFETLRASRDGGERPVENLLSEAEEPLSREDIFAGLQTELRVEGREVIKAPEKAPAIEEESAEVPEAVDVDVASATVSGGPLPARKPETDVAEQVSRTEPAAGQETFESGDRFFVQLASVKSREAAQDSWGTLQKSVPVLKPLSLRVQQADLGSRGTFYRVQAGPMSEGRAREVCATVSAQRPGGCFVVKN